MAATRLSDEQKAELVESYRVGATAAELAAHYGCSAATVTRVVKAALSPEDYERLKQERARGSRGSAGAAGLLPLSPVDTAQTVPQAVVSDESASQREDDPAPVAMPELVAQAGEDQPSVDRDTAHHHSADQDSADQAGFLAIDDADDFGDDSDAEAELEAEAELFVAVPVMAVPVAGEQLQCKPLEQAELPASAYMLVDKTVELEAKPLKEFAELGSLPPEEEERRALLLFANPRKAKQLCGRSQRVIKLPDPWVLHRTARYLVAQGITRVVVEGSLYSLPGS